MSGAPSRKPPYPMVDTTPIARAPRPSMSPAADIPLGKTAARPSPHASAPSRAVAGESSRQSRETPDGRRDAADAEHRHPTVPGDEGTAEESPYAHRQVETGQRDPAERLGQAALHEKQPKPVVGGTLAHGGAQDDHAQDAARHR